MGDSNCIASLILEGQIELFLLSLALNFCKLLLYQNSVIDGIIKMTKKEIHTG